MFIKKEGNKEGKGSILPVFPSSMNKSSVQWLPLGKHLWHQMSYMTILQVYTFIVTLIVVPLPVVEYYIDT